MDNNGVFKKKDTLKYTSIRIVKDEEMEKALQFYKENGIIITQLATLLLKHFYKKNRRKKSKTSLAEEIKKLQEEIEQTN